MKIKDHLPDFEDGAVIVAPAVFGGAACGLVAGLFLNFSNVETLLLITAMGFSFGLTALFLLIVESVFQHEKEQGEEAIQRWAKTYVARFPMRTRRHSYRLMQEGWHGEHKVRMALEAKELNPVEVKAVMRLLARPIPGTLPAFAQRFGYRPPAYYSSTYYG